jgi:hypothetical protein
VADEDVDQRAEEEPLTRLLAVEECCLAARRYGGVMAVTFFILRFLFLAMFTLPSLFSSNTSGGSMVWQPVCGVGSSIMITLFVFLTKV